MSLFLIVTLCFVSWSSQSVHKSIIIKVKCRSGWKSVISFRSSVSSVSCEGTLFLVLLVLALFPSPSPLSPPHQPTLVEGS